MARATTLPATEASAWCLATQPRPVARPPTWAEHGTTHPAPASLMDAPHLALDAPHFAPHFGVTVGTPG